jgi:three-Cys-motif partner protein
MDTSQTIQEHSKEKLSIFKTYLTNYLSVMVNVGFFEKIYIWDVFAGSGKDKHGNKGSAIIAAAIIKNFIKKHNKDIFFIANELDKKSFEKLKKNLPKHNPNIGCRNYSANELIKNIIKSPQQKSHHMFFIDPFGYTQCSPGVLIDLFNMKNSDHLMFIPISHVHRFAKLDGNAANKFIKDLGANIKDKDTPDDLINSIENALKQNVDSNYVYSYKITNRKKISNKYALFFISKHQLGAEKFLEAKIKIADSLEQQQLVFDFCGNEFRSLLLDFIKQERTNHEVFDFGIQNGFLSTEINKNLKELLAENKIIITPKNNRGAFYLKNKNKTIKIRSI